MFINARSAAVTEKKLKIGTRTINSGRQSVLAKKQLNASDDIMNKHMDHVHNAAERDLFSKQNNSFLTSGSATAELFTLNLTNLSHPT